MKKICCAPLVLSWTLLVYLGWGALLGNHYLFSANDASAWYPIADYTQQPWGLSHNISVMPLDNRPDPRVDVPRLLQSAYHHLSQREQELLTRAEQQYALCSDKQKITQVRELCNFVDQPAQFAQHERITNARLTALQDMVHNGEVITTKLYTINPHFHQRLASEGFMVNGLQKCCGNQVEQQVRTEAIELIDLILTPETSTRHKGLDTALLHTVRSAAVAHEDGNFVQAYALHNFVYAVHGIMSDFASAFFASAHETIAAVRSNPIAFAGMVIVGLMMPLEAVVLASVCAAAQTDVLADCSAKAVNGDSWRFFKDGCSQQDFADAYKKRFDDQPEPFLAHLVAYGQKTCESAAQKAGKAAGALAVHLSAAYCAGTVVQGAASMLKNSIHSIGSRPVVHGAGSVAMQGNAVLAQVAESVTAVGTVQSVSGGAAATATTGPGKAGGDKGAPAQIEKKGIIRGYDQKALHEDHIFSKQHVRNGVMELGSNKEEIISAVKNIIKSADSDGLLKEGSTFIKTKINGFDAEIRLFIEQGIVRRVDAFKGHSVRTIKNATIWM